LWLLVVVEEAVVLVYPVLVVVLAGLELEPDYLLLLARTILLRLVVGVALQHQEIVVHRVVIQSFLQLLLLVAVEVEQPQTLLIQQKVMVEMVVLVGEALVYLLQEM
jgi:hypothetical protein